MAYLMDSVWNCNMTAADLTGFSHLMWMPDMGKFLPYTISQTDLISNMLLCAGIFVLATAILSLLSRNFTANTSAQLIEDYLFTHSTMLSEKTYQGQLVNLALRRLTFFTTNSAGLLYLTLISLSVQLFHKKTNVSCEFKDIPAASSKASTRALIDNVRYNHLRLQELEKKAHFQNLKFSMLEGTIARDRNHIERQTTRIDALDEENWTLHRENETLLTFIRGQKNHIQVLTKSNATLEGLNKDGIKALSSAQRRNSEFTKQIAELKLKLASYDESLLKSPTVPRCAPEAENSRSKALLLPAPFAVVLVDGDAYRWSSSHFQPKDDRAGARAAEAIKNEVQSYLLASRDRLPLLSRIVVRVYTNFSGSSNRSQRPGGAMPKDRLTDFAKSFTESMPLFDFLDCGSGKERADSKIQASFHLFAGIPQCHTIFLAAVTDSGFARMLEQYACNEKAKKKTVLVHPGYVSHDTAVLNFTTVEWPTVFARRNMPELARMKMQKDLLIRKQYEHERDAAISLMIMRDGFRLVSTKVVFSYERGQLGRKPTTGTDVSPRNEGIVEEVD